VRYIGSKTSTLPALETLILARVAEGTFCDPFGGIGTVASFFKRSGFTVHTGDLLAFAHCFQTARVALNGPPRPTVQMREELGLTTAAQVISELQRSRPVRSWIHREFSVRRSYFTPRNAVAIDGVRRRLQSWHREGLTDQRLDLYLRACLIDAVDRVANTAGTYYAYLKGWSRKALGDFRLRAIEPVRGKRGCTATLGDARDLVGSRHFNVLYLDPPYNCRDYAGYYHLPETLATGRRPRPRGLSGVDAAPRPPSAFIRPKGAEEAMAQLIGSARCDLLVVHYSDNGLIPPPRLRSMLRSLGPVQERTIGALGYGTAQRRLASHRLYLVEP
jgi:adenine-specific DNA-methyltransferase